MSIIEALRKDEEIQELKKAYKEKFQKNAPPYNYDEYGGIEDYKKKLKEKIEKHPEK